MSIVVGVLAVQAVISSAGIAVPNVGTEPASQPLALPTEVVVYFNVVSSDWFAVYIEEAVPESFCNFKAQNEKIIILLTF